MNSKSKLTSDLYFLKPVLNFKEGCAYTGFSESWMYKLTHRGKIPHYKPDGKLVYFKTSELEEWLLRNKVASDVEIRSKAAKHSLT